MLFWMFMIFLCSCCSWFESTGIESQDSVEQKTRVQAAYEGGTVIINCTYQTSYTPTLFWYQQKVNRVPKYMLNRVGKTGDEDEEFKDRFNAHIDTSSKSVPLTIKDVLCVWLCCVLLCSEAHSDWNTLYTHTKTFSIHGKQNSAVNRQLNDCLYTVVCSVGE